MFDYALYLVPYILKERDENMVESKEISTKIENLRGYLYQLIGQNTSLIEKEVVMVSQELDKILNEYNVIINKKIA
ncbi:Spo0E like sporulation regulatory protein [Marinisporobacter balticus]|uniref:Spo0E like sporulation regulatory protein n=2 Tax=Marinisporobacter balticus TaxID=2018667 RepID=A0A4R2L7M1_9FIRM|nr:Spo0E like sporulation regulatory protein [Marinisporobacter balticus]